jgi:hypothetical protein
MKDKIVQNINTATSQNFMTMGYLQNIVMDHNKYGFRKIGKLF